MRARGTRECECCLFCELVRDGICVRVCVHRIASRAAPSCRVASLRRVQARAETGDCTLICPASVRPRPPGGNGPSAARDTSGPRQARFWISHFRVSRTTYPDAPNLENLGYRAPQAVVRSPFMIELGAPRLYCGRYPLKFSLLTFSRAESSLGRGDAPAKGADHQMAHPAPE